MMIQTNDDGNQVIYVDNSILSTYRSCQEKARLSYLEHLTLKAEQNPLVFGSAFHAGVAALTCGESLDVAHNEFIKVFKERGSVLPLHLEGEEKRSVERGLVMLDAYQTKWANEPYEVMRRTDDNTPYVEIGFRMFLMEWQGIPVLYCGLIDGIVKSKVDGRARVKETKTTSMGLSQYAKQTKPNHQITGYDWVCREMLGIELAGTIWDCAFISSRQPSQKGDRFERNGVSLNDFSRTLTTRSQLDIEEFLYDTRCTVREMLDWYKAEAPRWPRNTANCHNYGGCAFRDLCSTNAPKVIIENFYMKREWKPWEGRVVLFK